MSRFIDPTTDFGFKKIFGNETNKEIIMGFITDVLELVTPLLDIKFKDKEQLPEVEEERTGVYDIYCEDMAGNNFIVEMQKNHIPFTTDRMLYYSTFPIAAQAKKGGEHVIYPEPVFEPSFIGEVATMPYYSKKTKTAPKPWNYRLSKTNCIAVLGYALNGSTTAVNRYRIRNDQPPYAPFSDKLQFVTLELPFFDEDLPEYSLDRRLNKWLFFFKYLGGLKKMPDFFKDDEVFEKAFEVARYAKLTPKERRRYHLNIKRMRDTYAVLEGSRIEGRTEGRIEGRIEGKIEGSQNMLEIFLSQKLGPIPPEISATIRALNDVKQIHMLAAHFNAIHDWQTLQAYLQQSKSNEANDILH